MALMERSHFKDLVLAVEKNFVAEFHRLRTKMHETLVDLFKTVLAVDAPEAEKLQRQCLELINHCTRHRSDARLHRLSGYFG